MAEVESLVLLPGQLVSAAFNPNENEILVCTKENLVRYQLSTLDGSFNLLNEAPLEPETEVHSIFYQAKKDVFVAFVNATDGAFVYIIDKKLGGGAKSGSRSGKGRKPPKRGKIVLHKRLIKDGGSEPPVITAVAFHDGRQEVVICNQISDGLTGRYACEVGVWSLRYNSKSKRSPFRFTIRVRMLPKLKHQGAFSSITVNEANNTMICTFLVHVYIFDIVTGQKRSTINDLSTDGFKSVRYVRSCETLVSLQPDSKKMHLWSGDGKQGSKKLLTTHPSHRQTSVPLRSSCFGQQNAF